METIKRRQLKHYGHQRREKAFANVMINGRVEDSRGRPRREWEDDLKQWSGWRIEGSRRAGVGSNGASGIF